MKFVVARVTFFALVLSAASAPADVCSLWEGRSTNQTYSVKMYQAVSELCQGTDHRNYLITRKFSVAARTFTLAVDPVTAQIQLLDERCLQSCRTVNLADALAMPFYNALTFETSHPDTLQNDGYAHARNVNPAMEGVMLTADLCPAHESGFESGFFETLVDRARTQKHATPIGVSLTVGWANHHEAEFQWLKKQIQSGTLDITWVNHSYSHPYVPGVPLRENFLLRNKSEFPFQVLGLERFLIEHGELPSVFFRFPGLVSDADLIQQLKTYYLIPTGADAWLALGEKPTPGSIILVHGNLNEPLGIRLFNTLYNQTWPNLKLYSLSDGLGF